VLLPISAALELAAFIIFLLSVRSHRPAGLRKDDERMPVWMLSVLTGSLGFGVALLLNLVIAGYVTLYDTGPAFPVIFEARFLALVSYAFIVPTIWGFSARWLPTFLGLKPLNERMLRYALLLSIVGVLLTAIGFSPIAHWLIAIAAIAAVAAFHLFEQPRQAPKTAGVHASFPAFVQIAYLWLLIASGLGICSAYFDHAHGWIGASRHALTVGFVSGMVICDRAESIARFRGHACALQPAIDANVSAVAEHGLRLACE